VKRTDRLRALVEELRVISPRCASVRELSDRLKADVRTIEHDIAALQQAGVPIRAEAGPRGGYALDDAAPVPHLDFGAVEEPDEAAVARAAVARVIEQALRHRRVLRLTYRKVSGESTEREVEPSIFIGGRGGFWYLVGWCRLRDDVRVFRLDRITGALLTGEPAKARRQLDEYAPDIGDLIARDAPSA
jgi:predicted DNA-binding transcriptional regulator YafY